MAERLVVLGDRTANEVLEAAELGYGGQFSSIEKLYFDPASFATEDAVRLGAGVSGVRYIVGVASDVLKGEIVGACESVGWQAFTVVHPTAVVAPTATLGMGVFVGPLAVISSHAAVADHAIVHIHASVGHDARIGEYSAVLPGARISGGVVVGARSLIGSNAFIAAGKVVGEDCRVDALAYVSRDVAAGHLVSPRAPGPVRRVDVR